MTTRELFEAEFPVPEGVVWDDVICTWVPINGFYLASAYSHIDKWIGFQAGYMAGKENKNA
jgi:hypothetical protein